MARRWLERSHVLEAAHECYAKLRAKVHIDWPDADCLKILRACRRAVNPGGKMLVVENIIRPGNEFAPGKFLDLQMLIFPGGRD